VGFREKLAIILLIALLALVPAQASAQTVMGISKKLICQCGCTLVLANCTHSECGSREAMTALIRDKISQGWSEEEIIQFFVAQYGEQVLASPPKRGFNLTAWITPFAVILAGAGIIYLAIKKWTKRGRQAEIVEAPESEEEEEKYRQRLEEELKKFAERSFR
jgi:cytochrome c-type biogenesis protein CcmH